jgi:hypothetical protein
MVCSTTGSQLGRICQAIEELAAGSGDDPADAAQPGASQARLAQLAAIWEMLADADPELAKRLPGYLTAAE